MDLRQTWRIHDHDVDLQIIFAGLQFVGGPCAVGILAQRINSGGLVLGEQKKVRRGAGVQFKVVRVIDMSRDTVRVAA